MIRDGSSEIEGAVWITASLLVAISAIEIPVKINGCLKLGLLSELPPGTALEFYGRNSNERTIKVRVSGRAFLIFLEDIEPRQRIVAEPEQERGAPLNTERIQVMIGEDDHLLALRMQKELQLLGYAVQIRAGTPQEVVSLAATMRPDVILLDLNIGGDTHGVGVARDIHDITTIPTVFLSACPEEIVENAHAIPRPYRYVTKPFTGGDVHSAIQDLLSWRISRPGRRP